MADALHILNRVFINGFIVVMLFWMLVWDSDAANPMKKYWASKLQWIFVWLGLAAKWRMFSPDPPQRVIWPLVKMTMKNSDVVRWEPSSYAELSVWDKIRLKKFHRFYHEAVSPISSKRIRRDLVEYILQRKLHNGVCVKVELYLVFQQITSFGETSPEEPKPAKELIFTFHPAIEE